MGSPRSLIIGHHVHRRSVGLAALLLLAGALDLAAAVGLAYVAGFGELGATLARVSWPWVGALAGGIALSFVGYFYAYRGIYGVEDGPQLRPRQMVAVVVSGFGGFLAHGGSALDEYALRAAGADERDARARVSALAGLEHGILALIGTAAAIAVLVQGLSQPPMDFSIPWAVLPLPGLLVAFWAAERYRGHLADKSGWRCKVGVFLDSIHLIREMFRHPRAHGSALLGMAVFWVADAFAVWAGLVAFGFWMNAAALFIGYGTGMVFTRRTGPLAGSGILMLVLPVTIWYSGASMAAAVASIFAYRVLSVWLPVPFALSSLPILRNMADAETSNAEQQVRAPRGEPGLQGESG